MRYSKYFTLRRRAKKVEFVWKYFEPMWKPRVTDRPHHLSAGSPIRRQKWRHCLWFCAEFRILPGNSRFLSEKRFRRRADMWTMTACVPWSIRPRAPRQRGAAVTDFQTLYAPFNPFSPPGNTRIECNLVEDALWWRRGCAGFAGRQRTITSTSSGRKVWRRNSRPVCP